MTRKDPNEIKRIHIVGVGGVGFPLAVVMSRESMGRKLWVWDADTFEGGNGFRRLPAVSNPEQKKVALLRAHVSLVWGEVPPYVKDEWFTGSPPPGQGEGWLKDALVVDCTDMGNNQRKAMWEVAESHGAQMMRVSYDGNGVVLGVWGLPFGDTDEGGYDMMPSLGQSFLAAGVGACFIHRYLEGKPPGEIRVDI